MRKRDQQKCRLVAALLTCLLTSSVMATEPQSDTIDVDQINSQTNTTEAEQIQPKSGNTEQVGVDQLPESLEPGKNVNEDELEKSSTPARTLTAEVIAAWSLIRERGQTPTPDLIAREIGPDKLAEFLASSPVAGNILATGYDPDAQTDPAPKLPDGVLIIQPGSG